MLQLQKGQIRSGYVLAFFLLLISYFLIFNTTRQLYRETGSLVHSNTLMQKSQLFYTVLAEAETGVRGYVITRQMSFLKAYHTALYTLPVMYRELHSLYAERPLQRLRIDTLYGMMNRRLVLLKQTITRFQQAGEKIRDDREIITPGSMEVMDSIRLYLRRLNDRERAVVQQRKSNLSGFFSGARIVTIISLFTAILAIIYSLITYNKENRAKNEAALRAHQYGQELETNIRELKERNNELKELRSNEKFAATGRMARTIAHEVRNPLTNISLAAEQLQDRLQRRPESSLLLDMIRRNAERINQLVSDLLYATKFLHLVIRECSIHAILDQALEMARDRIGLQQIQVEKNYTADMPQIRVDPDKIKVALLNIIVNATEAMEKNKGVLKIMTRVEDHRCIIVICDNGSGMDEDTMQKIFEPYFTGKAKGNGLGLTNTQNIILNHKGSIQVQSQPGHGTCFTISLGLPVSR